MDPFAFASGGSRGANLKSPVVLQTMESENPSPEERKRIIEKWYESLQLLGFECIFDDALPPEHEFQYELIPLETTPLLTVSTESGVTQRDVDAAARARTALQSENSRKERTREILVRDLKAHVGLAILRAIEKNAPQLWKRMRRDHVLVAATADKPASYDGKEIFKAIRDDAGTHDKTRQDAAALRLKRDLELRLPSNVTSHQFGVFANRFVEDVSPYLLCQMPNEAQVKWIVSRLPEALDSDAREIMRRLRADGAAGDVARAIEACKDVCEDAHDTELGEPDVTAALAAHSASLVLADKAFVMAKSGGLTAQSVAMLVGEKKKPRTEGGGKGGAKGGDGGRERGRPRKGIDKLPAGMTCKPDGTCNADHRGWCLRSGYVNGTAPRFLAEDPAQLAEYEAARKEHCKKYWAMIAAPASARRGTPRLSAGQTDLSGRMRWWTR